MEVYQLFTTDIWISYPSFESHGIFSSLEKAIDYAKDKELYYEYGVDKDEAHIIIMKHYVNEINTERVFSTEFDSDADMIKRYYALRDNDTGDVIATGLNCRTKEEVKEELVSLMENGSEEDLANISLNDLLAASDLYLSWSYKKYEDEF